MNDIKNVNPKNSIISGDTAIGIYGHPVYLHNSDDDDETATITIVFDLNIFLIYKKKKKTRRDDITSRAVSCTRIFFIISPV